MFRYSVYVFGRSPSSRRAWIEIGFVDSCFSSAAQSPSSRRAWIEIPYLGDLRAQFHGSPSSRRAWIEIFRPTSRKSMIRVALLAEGVD